jgi:hypothetical protein
MSRQIELYRKVAADYDSMALLVNDQRLRNMFVGFAQQWREAALAKGIIDDAAGAKTYSRWSQEARTAADFKSATPLGHDVRAGRRENLLPMETRRLGWGAD